MELKKLPHEVSKILHSSAQIHSYRKIVEELVFNALDADASSIAVRIDFEERRIQVVDNGLGISEVDMNYVGSKNFSSKCVNLSTLRSLPTKYGFRGESITNIANVARSVKITSRYKNTNDTWQKIFLSGKLQKIINIPSRPSQGTTVEVIGCFYNLPIQNKSCNPVQEIHDIKMFLENLIIVHHSISVSLRNDATNEILLSIHKSRDIYQTIESVFNIMKWDLQELHVEKNNYKVISYIEKRNQNENKHHFIYLNGRYLFNCKVHRIFNDHLIKYLALKIINNNKSKYNDTSYYKDKDQDSKQIPFYIIFLTCPYDAYDINQYYKQSIVEFRDWKIIDVLLEKLVKFYVGDIQLKEIAKPVYNKMPTTDTRDRVKELMNKLFENNPHFGITQLHKGVKGKLMKRQKKKRCISVTEIMNNKKKQITNEIREQTGNIENNDIIENNANQFTINFENTIKVNSHEKHQSPNLILENSNVQQKSLKTNSKIDNLQKVFENKSDSVIRRCNELSKEAERLINNKVIIPHLNDNNKRTQISNEHFLKRKPKCYSAVNEFNKNKFEKINIITSFDLLQPIIVNIKNNCTNHPKFNKNSRNKTKSVPSNVILRELKTINEASFSMLTFESHKNLHAVQKVNTVVSESKNNKTLLESNIEDKGNSNRIQHKIYTTTNYEKIYKQKKTRMNKYNRKCEMKNKLKTKNDNYSKKSSRTFNSINHKSNFTIDFSSTNVSSSYQKLTANDINSYYKYKQLTNDKYLIKNMKHLNNYRSTEKIRKLFNDNVINRSEDRCNKVEQTNNLSEAFTVFECSQRNINTAIDYQFNNKVNDFDINSAQLIAIQDVGNNADDELVLTANHDSVSVSEIIKDKKLFPINENKSAFKRMNMIFISNSPTSSKNLYTPNKSLDPINLCEIVMKSNNIFNDNNDFLERDRSNNSRILTFVCNENRKSNNSKIFTRDSHDNSIVNVSSVSNGNKSIYKISNNIRIQMKDNDISQANEILKSDDLNTEAVYSIKNKTDINFMTLESMEVIKRTSEYQSQSNSPIIIENDFNNKDNFDFVDRPGFIPKGMSPIFTNCNSKRMEIQLDRNNLDKSPYKEFIRNVEADCEIYERKIQNHSEFTTAEIDRAQRRLLKDNAAIVFESSSLKLPKVLNQVDRKFIASKIMGRNSVDNTSEPIEYLVIFDQHAVHERIRLENNISDYLNGDCWKSVSVDEFVLKLSKEEMVYLYNSKEKLSKYGLGWNFLNANEISINAVPEAIVGKITRELDVVMKALKNLLTSIANEMKTQKGSTSLYAPSIMELVFSEACRYAIKFGDKLSKIECLELIKALSECKIPFQCAHGRPVLAVLLELKQVNPSFKVNMQKVKEFKNRG